MGRHIQSGAVRWRGGGSREDDRGVDLPRVKKGRAPQYCASNSRFRQGDLRVISKFASSRGGKMCQTKSEEPLNEEARDL